MKYISAIFESKDVQNLVVLNESLISKATNHLLNYNLFLQETIISNLNEYISEDNLIQTYNNISSVVCSENVNMIDLYSQILESELSDDEKISLFEEETSSQKESFMSRHKGKLATLGTLAAAGGAAYAGYHGKLGKDAQKKIGDTMIKIGSHAASASSKIATSGAKASAMGRDLIDRSGKINIEKSKEMVKKAGSQAVSSIKEKFS